MELQEGRERLEARITTEQKQLIRAAAELRGVTLTDFVVSTLNEAATKIVQEHRLLRLSQQDQQMFVAALLSDEQPNERLRAAAARHGYVTNTDSASNGGA